MQASRMNNPNYVNWIKVGTALQYVKEGLQDFANEQSKVLHEQIKSTVQQISSNASTGSCTSCTSKRFEKRKNKTSRTPEYKWTIRCSSDVCNHWLDVIIGYFYHGPAYGHAIAPSIHWANVEPTRWPVDHWQVAKTFLTHGYGATRDATDSDCSALLTLFMECSHFHKFLSNLQVLRDIRDHRNALFHSDSLEVGSGTCRVWLDDMIALLEDPAHFHALPQCQLAVKKIRELRDSPLEISVCRDLERQAQSQLVMDLGRQLARLHAQREADQARTGDLHDDLKKIRAQLQECLEFKSRIQSVESDLDASIFDEMKRAVQDLEIKCEQDQQQTAASILKIQTDVQKLQTEVKQLQTDSSHGGKTTKDIEGVRQRLITLYRGNCEDVPFYPLTPEHTGKLHKLYVWPRMRVQGRNNASLKPVTSYQDVFYSGPDICKNIYVVGEAGIGKSTFCDYLVHTWCSSHSHGEGHHSLRDIQMMKSFQLLFYISLRYASPNQSIEQMIASQLFDVDITDLLDENCLILLDGLDEWTSDKEQPSRTKRKSLPQFDSDCKCVVVTTSRPWKIECVRLGNNEVDRKVTIDGLGSQATQALAGLIIDELNKMQRDCKDVKDFMRDMENHKIEHFLKFPILLKQMVCLWHDGMDLGKSKFEIYSNLIIRQLQLSHMRDTAEESDNTNTFLYTKELHFPRYFDKLSEFQTDKNLLFALSRMAFYTLFNKKRESALVFDHSATQIHGMSDSEVKECLKIGLLSQKQLYGKITERRKSLNFIHKSNQEFFAALFLASNPQGLKVIQEVCTNLAMMQEIEDLAHFVSGINGEVCRELIILLNNAVSNDPSLKLYRENAEGRSDKSHHTLLKIQRTVMDLLTELAKNGTHDIRFPVVDLVVSASNVESVSSHLNNIDVSELVSVQMYTPPNMEQKHGTQFRYILPRLCNSKSLKKIILEDQCQCLPDDFIVDLITKSKETLVSLHLYSVDFKNTPQPYGIQKLYRNSPISLMLQTNSLLSLSLNNVEFQPSQIDKLCNFINKNTKQKELYLCGSPFATNESRVIIDLSKHSQLEQICLHESYMEQVRINSKCLRVCSIRNLHKKGCAKSMLECITSAPVLGELEVEGLQHAHDKQALSEVLPTLKSLETLKIRNINFDDSFITLSPDMKQLKSVQFFKVNIHGLALKHLLDKMPPQKVHFDLDMVTLITSKDGPHVPKYIKESERYSVIKLSKMSTSENKWLIRFDKLQSEDLSQTWVTL